MLAEATSVQSASHFVALAYSVLRHLWLGLRFRFEPSPKPGTGILPAEVATGAKFEMPGRAYFLARLDLHELTDDDWGDRVLWADPPFIQTPSLLWPDDHAWVLATEIDLEWTVVGGSRGLVDTLVRSDLEVEEIPSAWGILSP